MVVHKVGQVEIDSSAFLRQRNPVHYRLYGTIAQNPKADGAAMQICGGFEDLDARAGIVQIHTHDGADFVTRIAALIVGVGEIGLVLCLELLAGEAAAVVHLAHKCWEVGVAHAKRTVGLPILVGGNIHRPTDAQPQVVSNGTDGDRGPHGSVEEKKRGRKVLYLPNIDMVLQQHQLSVYLSPRRVVEASMDTSHVLEVQRRSVVIVAAKLAREFASVVGVVKVPELVRRHKEALVAEKATVDFGELCEIAQERCMTARFTLMLGRIALNAFFSALSAFFDGDIILGALVWRTALSA